MTAVTRTPVLPETTRVGPLSACAVKKGGAFQWVQVPPGETLQPEATGAGMEVTKCLKPLGSRYVGDGASVRAATRVNAEQPHMSGWESSRSFPSDKSPMVVR